MHELLETCSQSGPLCRRASGLDGVVDLDPRSRIERRESALGRDPTAARVLKLGWDGKGGDAGETPRGRGPDVASHGERVCSRAQVVRVIEEQCPGADARDCEGVFSGGVARCRARRRGGQCGRGESRDDDDCECAHGPDDVAKPLHRRSIAAPSHAGSPVTTVRSWFVPCRRSPFGFSARSRRWSTIAVWTCRVAASVHCSASCCSDSARSCRSTRWSTPSGVSRRPRAPGTWCTSTCRGSGACLAMRR